MKRVVMQADARIQCQSGIARPAVELGGPDEFLVFVGAGRQQASERTRRPTIANRNDFGLRLIVEKNTSPPGFTSSLHRSE